MTKKLWLGLLLLALCMTSNTHAGGEIDEGRGVETISNVQAIGVLRNVGTYFSKDRGYAVTELSNGTIFVYGSSPDHMPGPRDSLQERRTSAGIHGGYSDAEMWQPGLNGWKHVVAPPECKENRFLHTLTPLPDNRVLIAGGLCDGPKMLHDISPYLPYTKLSLWNGNTQKWETAPSLHVARLYHTASLLSDGSVLLVGGEPDPALYTAEHPVLDDVERYYDGIVSLVSGLHVARARHTATSLDNGALLIVGGVGKDGKALDSVELWNPVSQSWLEVPPLNTPRYNHSAVRLSDGSVMVAGGIGPNGQPLDSVEIWSPDTRKWSTDSSLLYPLQGHLAAPLANGDVLVMGGLSTGDKPTAQAERWDSSSRHWLPAGEMVPVGASQYDLDPNTYRILALVPHLDGSAHAFTRSSILQWTPGVANIHAPYGERDNFAATTLQDGRVMLSGGFRTGLGQLVLMDAADIFDPRSGRFSLTGHMHQRRFMHTSLVLDDGRVLVAGGWVWAANPYGTSIDNYPEVWDPETGEWSQLTAIHFNPSEWVHMARLQDGRVLFFGSDEAKPAEDGAVGQANYRAWLWNPANGQVEQKEVKMRPRSGAAVAILADGRVLRVGGYLRTFIPVAPCQPSPGGTEDDASECNNETSFWNEELDTSAEIWDSRSGETKTVTAPPQWDVRDGKTLVLRNGNVLFTAYRQAGIINSQRPSSAVAWLWDKGSESWQSFPALPAELQWSLQELADGTLVTASHQLPEGAQEWLPIQAVIQEHPRVIQNDTGDALSVSTVPPYAAVLDVTSRRWQIHEHGDIPPTWMNVPLLAALQDGRMMAVGRTERNPKGSLSAYIWDPATDNWSSAGRLVNQAHSSSMLQLPSGAVIHVGISEDNRLLCDLWDAASNQWQACGDYQMEYKARIQVALGLLEDGRAVVVPNTEEAFLFEPSAMQWSKHSIEWDTSGMTWGAPISSDIPLAHISDAENLHRIDISPVAGQYWQRTTGGGAIR